MVCCCGHFSLSGGPRGKSDEPDYCLDVLKKNFGEPAWATVTDDKSVILECEFCEKLTFTCDATAVTRRNLSIEDIRDKFLTLSRIFKTAEEHTGKELTKNRNREDAIRKYVEVQRVKWLLKRDFFLKTDPSKSKAFDARLEVLADIERLLTTAANGSARE